MSNDLELYLYICMYRYTYIVYGQQDHRSSVVLIPHLKLLPYQIPGGKTVKNVQIDPQTTEIWST